MKRLLLRAALLLACLPAGAFAAARDPQPDPTVTTLRGELSTPRSFEFSTLPRVSAIPYSGPVTEVKDEGVWAVAAQELARLKAHPELLPTVESMGGRFTFDAGANAPLGVTAPVVGNGFEGITQGGYIPGEPTVAAGPLNIFSAGNVNVTVTNKDGTNRVETNGAAFFGVSAGEGAISDAQCFYDALRGRFVAIAFTVGNSSNPYSNFYLAVSKTNDARGAWWQYKFDMTKDGTTPTANWSDYESVGLTSDKIVMTGQQFTFVGGNYAYAKIRVIDRAAVYAGSTVSYVDFVNFAFPTGGDSFDNFVTKCARNLTNGDATAHLCCVRTNGGANVTYRSITGPPSAPVLSSGVRVGVTTYGPPPDAVQKGSASLVPTNDCRPTDFYVRNGVLVVPWHVGLTVSGSAISAIRLLRLRTSDLTVLTDETYGAAGIFYYYPAATVDSAGSIYLGFDRSSSTEYPSAWASARRTVDAAIEPSALLKSGLSATLQSRWGDYTGIDNDVSLSGPGGTTAWYAGQWTKGTNTFGTWINKLSLSYGQVAGTVVDDCDGSAGTTGDRSPLAGVTVSVLLGATPVATTTTDATGAYNFGYLDNGTYTLQVSPPAGGAAVQAIAGTGATSQSVTSPSAIQVVLANTQVSAGNTFAVTSTHPVPSLASVSPNFKVVGNPGFTLTVNGASFTRCSVVRWNGSDRATTWVSDTQLTADIPASDLLANGVPPVTVFTPGPGGGLSSPQYVTVSSTPDTQAPVVTLVSPAGGETWDVGTAHDIQWTATDDYVVNTVDLALSTDGGATFPVTLATGLPNSGTWPWTVPLTPSGSARVRVIARDGVGNAGRDSSHTNFTIRGWSIAASAGAGGTLSPAGTTIVADGDAPAYTLTPATGYHVTDVLVNGVSVGAVTQYTFAPVHANQSIAASFGINQYTLTTSGGGNGTVDRAPDQATYAHGTLVTLTATPNPGFTFAGWTGDTSSTTNPLVVPMTGDRTINATFSQHTYTWIATGSAFWNTASNWFPARTTPATDDILIFNSGTSVSATSVPTQTIGRLIVGNGTIASLLATSTTTLTIAGGADADLDVQAGSTLQLNGNSQLTVNLGSAATGTIAGTVNFVGTQRLQALTAGSLVFQPGSSLNLGTGFTGNPFGAGTGASGLNSVVFQSGSLLAQASGADPFGALAPNSVVVFQPGSRFRLDAATTPSLPGRTYAIFEYNVLGTVPVSGTSGFTMDSLIVTRGTLSLNFTAGTSTIKGALRILPGATLGITPASGTPRLAFGGTTNQPLSIDGTLTTTGVPTFQVNNAAGVTLQTPWTLTSPLQFLSGRVYTGPLTLALGSTGTLTGAGQGSGWVVGNLRINVASGTSTRTFEIGDSLTYAPVVATINSAASAFDLNATTHTGDHPQIASSGLDPVKTANRSWTLSTVGSPTFGSADLTFGFATGDLDPGANSADFLVRRYTSGWSPCTTGTQSGLSTQATGLTAFGDFAVGELLRWTITASAGTGGGISPSGAVLVDPGASQGFTITPDANHHVADVLVDAVSVGAVTTYTFTNVTSPHTIAASFAGNDQSLAVTIVGGGAVNRVPNLAGYPFGSTVTLTAVPGTGWAFGAWSGDLTGATNPQDLLMDGAKAVTATFADTAAPVITVTSPNGGEQLVAGNVTPLTWVATDNAAVTAVDLLLSRTGAAGAYETLAVALPNTGTWDWNVDGTGTVSAVLRAIAHDAAGHAAADVSDGEFAIAGIAGVDDGPVTAFGLGMVRPNPTRGGAWSSFALPRTARVRLSLLDVQGREIQRLAAGEYAAGRHAVALGGPRLGAGLYFLRLHVEGAGTWTRRVVVTR